MSESGSGEPVSGSDATDKDLSEPMAQWVAGFFDGEGVVAGHVRKADENTIGYGINPQCSVNNRYVGGMFDAEGCIKATPVKHAECALGHSLFTQTVVSNNDDALMAMLSAFGEAIGIDYGIYKENKREYDPTFKFSVQKLESVETFLEAIYPYLIVKRRQATIMLNDILPLVKGGAHLSKDGFLKVMYHADRMNEGKGGARGKYTLAYFEDLWDMEYDDTEWF